MAEDKYKIGDRDDEVVCPYDKSHTFRCSRLPYHLMKCRHQYRGFEYQLCRYNARHEVPQPEIRYHEANCLDRAIIEPLITYEQQKNDPESQYYKGCTDIPNYIQSDENLPPPTENWDREISTMIRIGVDPNYLYNDSKINNTMGLAPSKKKQLNQYFLKKLNGENGQTSIQNIIDSKQQETDETQLNVSETVMPRPCFVRVWNDLCTLNPEFPVSQFQGCQDETAMFEKHGAQWLRLGKGLKRQLETDNRITTLESMKKKFCGMEMRPWQTEVIKRLDGQDERKILFVVDTVGNNGKTFLAKWLMVKQSGQYFNSTKYADVFYAVNTTDKVVVFDLTRDKLDFLNYGLLESLKNGLGFSSKYECVTKIFEPKRIVVFMNDFPDNTKLSADRWDIYDINTDVIV